MGDIASGSEFFLNLFPAFRSGGAAQIPFLKFIKDGTADLGDKFTYNGSDYEPVIL